MSSDDVIESPGLMNIEEISIVLDRILPKQISYVLLKCGTLVMISPEALSSVSQMPPEKYNTIFNSMEEWDYPVHRFPSPRDLEQIKVKNNKYLSEFLADVSEYTYRDKVYFQLALRYMRKCGYAYPGTERSDRNVDTPIPLDMLIVQENEHVDDHMMDQVMSLYREFILCSWPTCPGLFNHYLAAHADPKLTLDTVNKVLADLHRYDFIWPRFHCIRVGIDPDQEINQDLDLDEEHVEDHPEIKDYDQHEQEEKYIDRNNIELFD
jgi:hypothetical protein